LTTREINALNKAHDIIEAALVEHRLSTEAIMLYSNTRDGIAKVVEFENSITERNSRMGAPSR